MFNEHMFAFFVFVRVEEINNSELQKKSFLIYNSRGFGGEKAQFLLLLLW